MPACQRKTHCRGYHGRRTPWKWVYVPVYQEHSEAAYSQMERRATRGSADEMAIRTLIFARKGVKSVRRHAFNLARKQHELTGKEGIHA